MSKVKESKAAARQKEAVVSVKKVESAKIPKGKKSNILPKAGEKVLNKSQKESAMIRECLFEGDKVSNEVIRAIKAETRKMDTLHGMTGENIRRFFP